jgi:hypothetical protein
MRPKMKKLNERQKKLYEESLKVGAGIIASRPRQVYEETKNPIFLFKAYRVFRDLGQTPPEWIMEYFDRVALGLLTEANKRFNGGAAEDTPERIAFDIFEMRFKNRDPFNECVVHLNKHIKAREIASGLVKENPELLNEGKRARLIDLIAAEMNKSFPDDAEIKTDTLDRWFSRPITDDIEKWDRRIIKL